VVDTVARDAREIKLLGHRDTEEAVEVVFLDTGDRLIALEVNDLPS